MARKATKKDRLTEDVRTRVSPGQRERIFAAATKADQSPSDFIREAALHRAEHILSGTQTAYEALQDFVGALEAPVTRSAGTGAGLKSILEARRSGPRRQAAGPGEPSN